MPNGSFCIRDRQLFPAADWGEGEKQPQSQRREENITVPISLGIEKLLTSLKSKDTESVLTSLSRLPMDLKLNDTEAQLIDEAGGIPILLNCILSSRVAYRILVQMAYYNQNLTMNIVMGVIEKSKTDDKILFQI